MKTFFSVKVVQNVLRRNTAVIGCHSVLRDLMKKTAGDQQILLFCVFQRLAAFMASRVSVAD